MLADPLLIKRIVTDIESLGVAGETQLAAVIYLIGTSRLLEKPNASIVQGPTSSGKSYVIDKVAPLFPPEAVVRATSITPQALYYMPPGSLVHKFVIGGERCRLQNDDAAEATGAIRQMISEGRLTKLVTIKVKGEMTTAHIQQDGPIAFVETTTQTRIFEEDLNRCLLIHTDEREEQTRNVISTLARRYGGHEGVDADRVIQRHHALQRLLEPVPIVVPYAERLGELFDTSRVEARRAFPHTLNFLKAVVLLHQRQRDRDGAGRLIAMIDDYAITRRLLAKPMARLLGRRLSDAARRFLERLRQWVEEERPDKREFTTRAAIKEEQHSDRAVRGWLSELYDGGLVDQIEAGKGSKPATWKLGKAEDIYDAIDATSDGLPTVEELQGHDPGIGGSGNAQVVAGH